MINAGELDRRITLQRKTITVDSYGAETVSWATLATVWGKKTDMRGAERYTAVQSIAEVDTKFVIRYRRGLNPVDRIACEGRTYDVGGILEIGRHEGMEIHAKARAE